MSFIQYLKDTKAEMKHVNWPTKAQAINYTLLVILLSVGVAALLGAFDTFFSWGLGKIIIK